MKEYMKEYMNKFLILQYENRRLTTNVSKLMKINKEYCLQNNYEYIFINEPYDLPPYWIKVYLVKEFLQSGKYKGILWLDSDACIYNNIRLEDMLIKDKYFYKSPDNIKWNSSFNAGVFLVLNNEIGKNIMNDWMKSYNKNKWSKDSNVWVTKGRWGGINYEQGSFIKISHKYHKYIHTFNWRFLQSSYSDTREKETCVFTLHFAGKDYFKSEISDYLKSLKKERATKKNCKFLKSKTRKRIVRKE